MALVSFLFGLLLLVGGAEALVRGASRLAASIGVSPLVIGLTVVAFGTSAPEMAVSARAALQGGGGADVALGNVVGSNVFNVLVILGLASVVSPLVVAQKLVRVEVPLMIGVSFLIWFLARDGSMGRIEGAALFTGILLYTAFAILEGRRASVAVREEYEREFGARRATNPLVSLTFVAGGLVALVLGAGALVDGAVAVARTLGVSELVISLTLVAGGTSLPELATSVTAGLRGERDIAVGNVVGSNLFNLLAVLGLAAWLSPGGVPVAPPALGFDIPVMVAVAVACLPIFFTGWEISRWEGAVFLVYYGCYVSYLFLAATQHARLPVFSSVMWMFVLPLTVLSIVVSVAREIRARRRRPRG